ncbi:Sterile alpha motif domain-containing protein 11 [Eumeta japonica]|uniref:Sterile alpha motif domain-containing protein 11 n=1 Tax=Eumeta variegata TaxID=151549 RepID=A0A4C1Y276_EUMVA|nr:Sterile alpha motif domain-containing protein 11 [Eumeta japonica]
MSHGKKRSGGWEGFSEEEGRGRRVNDSPPLARVSEGLTRVLEFLEHVMIENVILINLKIPRRAGRAVRTGAGGAGRGRGARFWPSDPGSLFIRFLFRRRQMARGARYRFDFREKDKPSKFREQRIDGSGLPLLTEEHLTGMLQMKLGPALKLRALLARKKAECPVCSPAKVNGALKSEPRSNTTSPS